MYTYKELKKAAKSKVDGKEYRLAVLGNCATQLLSKSIEGMGKIENMNLDVFDADYNQIDLQLLDPASETYTFKPDYILLFISTDKIYEEYLDMDSSDRDKFAQQMIDKIEGYWELISQNSSARILQMNFTEINDKVLGNYSAKIEFTFTYQIRKLDYLLQEKMSQNNAVYPVDLLSVQLMLGTDKFYNAPLYYNTKMTIDVEALPYVAANIIDVLKAMQGNMKKCAVLDLDNTLWGGVIGDDGLGEIEIGELGRGHAFSDFQRWLKQLKDRGVLLAVCSKNNEETAKEPFENHEEMILRLSDIAIFVANWEDKATNIRYIQESLNIGMDSIVFIDDNPFERNLVRTLIPEITVPELPEDPADYLSFLQNSNLFEAASYSSEDRDRTGQYQAEFQRKELAKSFSSIDDYLKGLDMVGEAKPFEPLRYARISQLTQRSNQFNLRTVRYSEDEIQRIAEDDDYLTLYYTLRDKFGDHGLVSVMILKKLSDKELFIDTWLMSCRVLKRGMEEFIINKMVESAKAKGYSIIRGEYIPTSKNAMVQNIYEDMGFKSEGNNQYVLDVNKYEKLRTYIKEEV